MNLLFEAEFSGELGIGELVGDDLEVFLNALENHSIGESVFIDTPFEFANDVKAGLIMTDEQTDDWEIPNAYTDHQGSTIGFPKVSEDQYKPGTYLIYTVLSDRYQVNIDIKSEPELTFEGAQIDIAFLEPDFEAGELTGMLLATALTNGTDRITIFDHMEDIDGLRQSVLIVKITEDGEIIELYQNTNGEDVYYEE